MNNSADYIHNYAYQGFKKAVFVVAVRLQLIHERADADTWTHRISVLYKRLAMPGLEKGRQFSRPYGAVHHARRLTCGSVHRRPLGHTPTVVTDKQTHTQICVL